jgi:hypothetical protein
MPIPLDPNHLLPLQIAGSRSSIGNTVQIPGLGATSIRIPSVLPAKAGAIRIAHAQRDAVAVRGEARAVRVVGAGRALPAVADNAICSARPVVAACSSRHAPQTPTVVRRAAWWVVVPIAAEGRVAGC